MTNSLCSLCETIQRLVHESGSRANDRIKVMSIIEVIELVTAEEEGAVGYEAVEDLAQDEYLFVYELVAIPASKTSVDALERKRVDDDDDDESAKTVCVVCQCEFGIGGYATMMPCAHEYHEGCILEWLHRACRFELPTA